MEDNIDDTHIQALAALFNLFFLLGDRANGKELVHPSCDKLSFINFPNTEPAVYILASSSVRKEKVGNLVLFITYVNHFGLLNTC
jgi:hypothetical protein